MKTGIIPDGRTQSLRQRGSAPSFSQGHAVRVRSGRLYFERQPIHRDHTHLRSNG